MNTLPLKRPLAPLLGYSQLESEIDLILCEGGCNAEFGYNPQSMFSNEQKLVFGGILLFLVLTSY